MQIKMLKNLKKRVTHFSANEDLLYLVDESNRVLIFSKNLIFLKGFKLKLPDNRPDEKSTKFSTDSKYLAITIKNITTLWDLNSKKHIANFKNKFDILSIGFDKENRYLVMGDIAGEIKLYNLEIKKKVADIARHKDFITDISISDDLSEVIAGCYDKCVLFVNCTDFSKKERYLHIKKVKKVENKSYLVSADNLSDIVKWDLIKIDTKDRVDFYKEFRDFYIDEDILVVLTQKGVILYDLKAEVILNDNFLEFENGDKVYVFGHFLIISDENVVWYLDLFEDEGKLLDFILEENFKSAYDLIDKNPFLKRSRGYERLERMIELIIKKAKDYFEIDPLKGANYLQKLLVVPHLRSRVEEIIKHYTNLIKFKNAVFENNFSLAYQLISQYPLLKETKYYQLLEKKWEIAFEKALKLLKEGKVSEAKEILTPFMTITQKQEIIEFILKDAKLLFLLREKLAKRDFKGFFDLIKAHPQLKNTKEYKKVIEYANNLYKKAVEFLKNEDFKKAKKAASILIDFPDFESKAVKILRKIEISLKFLAYLSEKNYEKAFELVKLYPFLKELKEYKDFINKWNDYLYKAEILMSEGKKEEAYQLVKDYKNKYHLKRINEMLKIES